MKKTVKKIRAKVLESKAFKTKKYFHLPARDAFCDASGVATCIPRRTYRIT